MVLGIMPFVLEADGDTIAFEGPKVLAEPIVEFALSLRGEEGDHFVAAIDGLIPVSPHRVGRVGTGNTFGVARVPGVFRGLYFRECALAGEWRDGVSGFGHLGLLDRVILCVPQSSALAPMWHPGCSQPSNPDR